MGPARWVVIGAVVLQIAAFAGLAALMSSDLARVAPLPDPAARRVPVPAPLRPHVDVLAGELNQPVSGEGWRMIGHLSAHRVLVIRIETQRLDQARAIAAQLVHPIRDRYVEALIYFYRPDALAGALASRRVQWTPAGGYVEDVYDDR